MKKTIAFHVLFLAFAILFAAGCSSASVRDPSGFLPDYSGLREGRYFKQEYIAPKINFSEYQAVKVAPVNFSYLDDKTSCGTDELESLGHDFRKNIEEELSKEGFAVTSNPTGKTLVISIAVTNIEPPNAIVNIASNFSPVPLPLDTDGKTAFEAKITDGTTGKILLEMAEQQSGSGEKLSITAMAVGSYLKFVNTKAVFEGWASNIGKLMKDLKEGKELQGKSQAVTTATGLLKTAAGLAI